MLTAVSRAESLAWLADQRAGEEEVAARIEAEWVTLLGDAPLGLLVAAARRLPAGHRQGSACRLLLALGELLLDGSPGPSTRALAEAEDRPADRALALWWDLVRGVADPPTATKSARESTAVELLAARGSGASTPRFRPVRPAPLAFSLDLLGNPEVFRLRGDGRREPIQWTLKRSFLSVVYLALAPERQASKEELTESIWTDASADAITRNFHPTLSTARRLLLGRGVSGPDPILFRRGLYSLLPEARWQVDVERFEGAIAEGETLAAAGSEGRKASLAVWRNAWLLYRGPLLSGYEADWIRPLREKLRRRYLVLLHRFGDLAAELGHDDEALDAYRSYLLEDQFEEKVHASVMELYGRRGRRDLVRRQFVRLQDALEELSVEPLESTQELYHRLMR